MADVVIRNYMEDCVRNLLPTVIAKMNICKCEQCQTDILACALNNLPPRYIATKKGHLFSKLEAMHTQFDADIITALSNGIAKVSANPFHD